MQRHHQLGARQSERHVVARGDALGVQRPGYGMGASIELGVGGLASVGCAQRDAAGVDAGGVYGRTYGGFLGWSLVSGRKAGRSAAAFIGNRG